MSLNKATAANSPKRASNLPFYEPVSPLPTSSQIIKEAREKLHETKRSNTVAYAQEATGLIRTINSTRPFTPREDKRTLFGPKSTRPINERPPSSFLIGSKSFEVDPSSSRPISATRLSPIEKSTNPKLASQSSLDIDPNGSRISIDGDKLLPSANNSSPKSTVKSRLAPLELTNEKLKSIKIREFEFESKLRDVGSATSTTSSIASGEANPQTELNWKQFIEPMLNHMHNCFKENLVEEFCEACDRLSKLLETHGMLAKSCPRRSGILKIIFKYLDTDNDKIKLKVAKIILNMKVSSNNLTNICRLLFSISRNTDNDLVFIQTDFLEPLLSSAKRLDFKTNPDSVTYFCGTMKNLSENNKLLKQLSQKNLEEILTKIIKDLSKYYSNKETLKTEVGHALVQITASLRNLADLSGTRHKFLSLNLIEELVGILKYFSSDSELMLNVSRILSKLTLHADFCQKFVSYNSIYKAFIKIMLKHDVKQDLIVRVGFILGNVTSRHDEARVDYMSEKYAIDTLIKTLKLYLDMDENSRGSNKLANECEESEPNGNEDVLIKLVRVIANIAINEQAGVSIANRQDIFEILLRILESKDLSCEELIIDTIVTINNLSFYNSNIIINNAQDLIDSLMRYLLSNNYDAILEVFRVFANLSRHRSVRNYLISKKVNKLAIAYLNSNNRELVYIVIGVLINMMTDPENRLMLKKENGISKLIEILTDLGPTDWQLSSMICQLFMNYSEVDQQTESFRHFDHTDLILLHTVLSELLDEEFAISTRPGSNRIGSGADRGNTENGENIDEYVTYLWKQDFSPVAGLLLQRVVKELGKSNSSV